VSLKALNALMELPSENQDQAACMDFGALNGDFVMEDVSFAYPGSDSLALDRVSLRIRPGEKVGVIGKMGSGKSSLGKLLIGLYQPKDGAVSFGGVDIRQLATADLRSKVGFLPQEVILFYGTVRDNIALGDPTINDHLVLRASAISGVADFVKKHPAGYGAQVGEQGRNLSGGQRQAVGLARALVRDPDILILDEPTSNMDVESELVVQRRLAPIIKDKTLILITHRLSMLRIVDRIIVMDGGKVAMDGPRDAVLERLRQNRAEAEAKAHGKALEEVHFHEVGAIDSIVDIVSAAVLFDDLGETECVVTGLTEGTGTVQCAHGELPVPVPAVLNIAAASGIPLRTSDTRGECVTPTGIALAAAFRTCDILPSAYRVLGVGTGLGKRDYGRPSILRIMRIEAVRGR
jgi:ABC-type multidrug transport system ATPase subunit